VEAHLISINFTLLVQLVNFLVLLVILNFLLFKPILKVLDDRAKLLKDSAELKERLGTLADENISEYESKLHSAKQESMLIRADGRTEALAQLRQIVQETKANNVQELDKAREALKEEAERSRKILQSETENLAEQIATKLVGRYVGGKA
jgi:F-type H+-transporting ATPase subunit b